MEVDERIKKEEPEFKELEAEFENIGKSEPEAVEKLKSIQKEKQEILSKRSGLGRELGRVEAQLEFQSQESLDESVDIKSALKEIKSLTKELLEENDIAALRGKAQRVLQIVEGLFTSDGKEDNKSGARETHKKLLEDLKSFDEKLERLSKEEQ